MTACTLKYLVRGVKPDRESQRDLQSELYDCLPNASSIVVLPVVDGFSVEIEVESVGACSRPCFVRYIGDHVVPEAVQIRCHLVEAPQLKLLNAHFA